nr:hypothetical protein [Tanacetum cinerariifolium]
CQLDEQWFVLTKETLREALQITPVNNNQEFAAPPSIDGLIDFVNQLGYPKLARNLSNVVTNDLFQPEKEGHSNCDSKLRFTKLIIHHLQRRHRFHPRPDSPLYLPNEEPVLGYLKFSAKGTKREVFGDPPTPKPTQPARKPKTTAPKAPSSLSVSIPVRSAQPAPTSAPAKPQEKKRKQATETSYNPPKANKSKHGWRMWESESYKSHKDHMHLFEVLEKSMNSDHSEELTQDLAEARKKKKKSRG